MDRKVLYAFAIYGIHQFTKQMGMLGGGRDGLVRTVSVLIKQ